MDMCDNRKFKALKKGQKKRTMSRANMRFPISDKIIDKLYTKAPLSFVQNHMLLLDWTRKFQP